MYSPESKDPVFQRCKGLIISSVAFGDKVMELLERQVDDTTKTYFKIIEL